jgi:type VI secretion system FHA domain protein
VTAEAAHFRMFLILEVTGRETAALGAASRAIFTTAGGSIGRRAGNDWVLPDPHVSGRHARVRAIGGTFFLEDNESGNGVIVNGNRLHPNEPFPLKEGDRVFIDPFEIVVHVSTTKPGTATEVLRGQAAVPPMAADPASAQPLPSMPAAPTSQPLGLGDIVPDAGGAIPSDFNPLLEPAPAPPQTGPTAASLQGRPVIHDAFDLPPQIQPVTPVTPAPPPGAIPVNWDVDDVPPTARPPISPTRPLSVSPAPMSRAPQPPPAGVAPAGPAAPYGAISADFASLLRGAGVPAEALTPEVMAEFGQVLRSVIEGLMEVLRARGEIRNEFRLPQTTFKTRDNNPLKMAVNAEDAIHNLLVKRNPAYLGTTAAFDDAFKDVRHHQLAMLAGMRAAFEFMLQRFNPASLRAQFDARPGRRASLGFGGQGRYWEAFEEYYKEATADADDCFRRLFGDQFARAYEEQIQSLRAGRGGRG